MGRHETDVLSLACGLIFLLIGSVFLTGEVDPAEFLRVWALPITLLGAGLVLGSLGLARHRRLQVSDSPDELDEGSHPALW